MPLKPGAMVAAASMAG